jgi:hypothetical protein
MSHNHSSVPISSLTSASWWTAGTTAYWMGVTSLSAQVQPASSAISSVKVISGGTAVDSILSEFPDLTRPKECSERCATTQSTTAGLYQAHLSPDDHVDWHQTGSLLAKSSSTPCCGTAQLAAPRVPGPRSYISCLRRTTVGVLAVTIER